MSHLSCKCYERRHMMKLQLTGSFKRRRPVRSSVGLFALLVTGSFSTMSFRYNMEVDRTRPKS